MKDASGMERPTKPPRNGARLSEAPAGAERQTIDTMKSWGSLGSVGLSFVISIVLGVGLGLLVDRWIGTGPWGFFIGFFLGVAAGVVTVVRASKSIK